MALKTVVTESKDDTRAPEGLHKTAAGKAKPKAETVRLNQHMDRGIWKQLKVHAAETETSMKDLIEAALVKVYGFKR